jgi:hypothetical protein
MKNFLERIKSPFKKKSKPESQAQSAVDEPPTQPKSKQKPKADRFTLISWAVTILVVVSLLGGTLYYKSTLPPQVVTVSEQPTQVASDVTPIQNGQPRKQISPNANVQNLCFIVFRVAMLCITSLKHIKSNLKRFYM